ncbi:MAG: hypothetical protein WD490_09525 [Opitutales bacterium]
MSKITEKEGEEEFLAQRQEGKQRGLTQSKDAKIRKGWEGKVRNWKGENEEKAERTKDKEFLARRRSPRRRLVPL